MRALISEVCRNCGGSGCALCNNGVVTRIVEAVAIEVTAAGSIIKDVIGPGGAFKRILSSAS